MTVALIGGLLAFAATPAHAAVPFDTQNFLPDDTSGNGVNYNLLSDRFDGTDSLAHLTNVSTPDTDRVKWFACPDTTTSAGNTTFGGVTGDQNRLANCTIVIGEDTTPRRPTGGNAFAPTDEAYDINWDIPGTLDGATRDILALACAGAGEDVEGSDANCRGDIENDVFLEDAQTGAIASQTTAGEMFSICTDDVTTDGPGTGGATTRVCEQASVGTGTGQQTQAQLDARFKPFLHGDNVPNNGFVIRATTSDDVTGLTLRGGAGDAQTDPHSTDDYAIGCTLLQTGTNFDRWECAASAANVADDKEQYIAIDEAGGAGFCASAVCGLDSHYVVSGERVPTTAVLSFTPTFAAAGSPSSSAGCEEDETADKDEVNAVPAGTAIGSEEVEGCLNDQFTDDQGAGVAVTFEATGPDGTGFSTCSGSTNTGTGTAPRLHDHDGDGRFEHCHTTTDAEGLATAVLTNFTDFNETASPGDQVVTFCHDAQFSGTSTPAAQPANHGCADATVKDTVTNHWVSLPSHVHLVFGGTGDPANPCHSGDTFKENEVGDSEELLACTLDGQDNPATTNQTNGGRLQWFIAPAGGGELTATRFASTPPSETGTDGRATTTLEAFRPGNDDIFVELRSDTGGLIGTAARIQKRVVQSGQETACSDGRDNDGDGRIDLNDPGCSSSTDDSEAGGGPGDGQPPPACRNRGPSENVIAGTNGDDVLVGTSGRDIICGAGGDDVISGRGGADLITGNGGNDTIGGGRGKDNVSGNGGNDNIGGNKGNDSLKGNRGNDALKGHKGVDTLSGGGGNDTLQGGNGDDVLKGGSGNDTLRGGKQDDALDGGPGRDQCIGGPGNDSLRRCP